MKILLGAFAIHLCVVDKTTDTTIIAEAVFEKNKVEMIEIPRLIIPCNLKEGDVFYFIESADVVEVRCGEPEPS